MADTEYRVLVRLESTGNLDGAVGSSSAKVAGLGSAVGSVSANIRGLGSSFMALGSTAVGALEGVISRVESIGLGLAKWGAIGAIGLIAHDVIGLNNQMEQTQISLAAMFSANELADGFGDGMRVAADQMEKLHKDASKLPVAFKDVAMVMRDITVPGAQAGMNPDQIRKMAGAGMLAGHTVMPTADSATIGRELAMLLEGRAGAHNTLGLALGGLGGEKAAAFNKEGIAQRRKDLEEMIAKYAPAMEAEAKSFSGVSSTFLDELRGLRQELTKPLFEHVTRDLGRLNDWLDANHDKVTAIVDVVADKLVAAWDWVVEKVSKVGDHLDDVRHFVDHLFSEETIQKAEHLAKLFAEYKLATTFGPGLLNVGVSAVKLGASMGAGMGGAAGAAAGTAEGAGGVEAATGAVAGLGGAAAGGAIAIGVLAVALFSLYGAFDAAEDDTSSFHDFILETFSAIEGNLKETGENLKGFWAEHGDEVKGISHLFGAELTGAAKIATGAMAETSGHIDLFGSALQELPGPAGAAASAIAKLAAAANLLAAVGAPPTGDNTGAGDRTANNELRQQELHGSAVPEKEKVKIGGGGGGGGTNIQKVEIVVNQNDDPSRVARKVKEIIWDERRFPTGSRYAPNYSATR